MDYDLDVLTTDNVTQVASRNDNTDQWEDEDLYDELEDDVIVKEEQRDDSDGEYEADDDDLYGSRHPAEIAAVFEREVCGCVIHASIS